MNIEKIDSYELGSVFKGYCLDKNNIIDFLIDEDHDKYKYLLKLYLLSLLENYRHIDRLQNYVFLEDNFKCTPSMEIVNRLKKKDFWEKIKYNKEEDNSEKMYWIEDYIPKFVELFIKTNNSAHDELRNMISNENNLIKRTKLKNDLNKKKKYIKQEKKEIVKKFNKAFRGEFSIDKFEDIVNKMISIIAKKEKMSTKEWLYDYYSFNNGDKKIINYLKIMFDKDNIIDFLKEDLVFNYNVLVSLFDEKVLDEDNLETIIYKIRSVMSYNEVYSRNNQFDGSAYFNNRVMSENPFNTDYRKYELNHDTKFFSNTASVKDIQLEMNKLFSKYKNIENLDDNKYVLECYKLTQEFLQIHPYADGNGRTSKYLFYFMLFKRNILPFTITDDNNLTSCYKSSKNNNSSIISYVQGRNQIMVDRVNKSR